jgi:8-oxo-dGTP diphosphatase
MNEKKKVIEVCAAVIFDGHRVLIASRPEGREYAGYWEFPGGKIEPGESKAACLKRELLEELSMQVAVFDQIYFTEYEYPQRIVRLFFIRCLPLNGVTELRPRENQEYRWVQEKRLKEVRFLPADEGIAGFLSISS